MTYITLKAKDTLSIKTGRQYNGEQKLECSVVSVTTDPDWYDVVVINVTDDSRNMKFRVQILLDEPPTLSEIERLVIGAYDHGEYKDGHAHVELEVGEENCNER